MSPFLLDTSILTLLHHGHPNVLERVQIHQSDPIQVSTVSVDETLTGWYTKMRKVKSHAETAAVSKFLAQSIKMLALLPMVPQTVVSFAHYDRLVKLRLNIGSYDLRIASIALELGAIVVTNNLRDFRRVPSLVCEDWSV